MSEALGAVSDAASDPQVAVSKRQVDTAGLLGRIFERPLRFGESDLARALSHLGEGSRLRAVMRKLVNGAEVVPGMQFTHCPASATPRVWACIAAQASLSPRSSLAGR